MTTYATIWDEHGRFSRNLHVPEDADNGEPWLEGYDAFWAGAGLLNRGQHWQAGWWMAWTRCYGQGVKASVQWCWARAAWERKLTASMHGGPMPGLEPDELDNPYEQFSGAWEAWGQGADEEARL